MGLFSAGGGAGGGGGAASITVGSSTTTDGTVGSVLFVATGPILQQDNANFFWDDTNNRLGIGTASPAYQLDVLKNGRMRVEAGVGAGFWYNGSSTASLWFVGTSSGLPQDFRFYMGNDALKLGSANTTNPSHQFFQEVAAVSASHVFLNLAPTINQGTTSGYTVLKTTVTETATGSGTKALLDLTCAGTNRYLVERGRHRYAYAALSADTTLDDSRYAVTVDASGAVKTITLPAASGLTGAIYTIKKIDSSSNAVIIDGNASETIDGATTLSLTVQYQSYTIICDGSNWHII